MAIQVGTDGIIVGDTGVVVSAAEETPCCCGEITACYKKLNYCFGGFEAPYVAPCALVGGAAFILATDVGNCIPFSVGATVTEIPSGYTVLTAIQIIDDCGSADTGYCNCCPSSGDSFILSWSFNPTTAADATIACCGEGCTWSSACAVAMMHQSGTLSWTGPNYESGTPGTDGYIYAEASLSCGETGAIAYGSLLFQNDVVQPQTDPPNESCPATPILGTSNRAGWTDTPGPQSCVYASGTVPVIGECNSGGFSTMDIAVVRIPVNCWNGEECVPVGEGTFYCDGTCNELP